MVIFNGYHSTLISTDHVTNAVQILPNYLRHEFNRNSETLLEVNKAITLLQLEVWL